MPDHAAGPTTPSMRINDIDAALPRDEMQELKEAICDLIVERTRRVVSGEGGYGRVIYNAKPSRVLVSGFILPRLSSDNENEASDISIPTHGLDCRILADAEGTVRVRPRLSVYVRALPTSEELFETHPELRPKARLSHASEATMRQMVRDRVAAARAAGRVGGEQRRRIQVEVYADLGILVPTQSVPTEDGGGLDGRGDENVRAEFEDRDLRIPDNLSVRHDIPEKYVRLEVDAPELTLALPYDERSWAAAAAAYDASLMAAVARVYADWAASDVGREIAWRPREAPSSAFWSRQHWDTYLARVRADPPQPTRPRPRPPASQSNSR